METSAPGSVSQEILETKIKELEATTGMQEEAKTKLIELYRRALSNLRTASSTRAAAHGFRQAKEAAPAELQALREEADEASATAPEDTLEADLSTPLRELERLLEKEKADFAAVDARRAELNKRLHQDADRPALIQRRLTDAKEEQADVAARLKLPTRENEGPVTDEARRWALETRYQTLSTEIDMLDQELLSQPMRVDLMKAQRDKAAARVGWVGTRVKILAELVNTKRKAEAEKSKARAEKTRRAAQGEHPLVIRIAEENARVSEEIAASASRLDELGTQAERMVDVARQLEEDFKSAKETIAIGGLSQDLGHMLFQQGKALPDQNTLRRETVERDDEAAKIGLRRLQHRRDSKTLRDLDAYVAMIVAEADLEDGSDLREQIRELAKERRGLLDQGVSYDDFHLRKLAELDTAQQRLLQVINEYESFLNEHLLWVRSTSPAHLQELGALPEQAWRLISPTGWIEVAQALAYQGSHSPAYALLALAFGALLWQRKRMITKILSISDKLGKPTTDSFFLTLQAGLLTAIVAGTWPLLVAVTGWQLKITLHGTDFSTAVGEALLAVAAQFYYLRGFRMVCIPNGLASTHFRWPESSLKLLRKELDLLSWVFVPSAMVTLTAFFLDPLNVGWAIGRTSFLIMVASLSFGFYRMLNVSSEVLEGYLRHQEKQTFRRLHRLWYPLLVAAPLALGVLSLLGYIYTAGTLLRLLLDTTWLAVELILLFALAVRWSLVTRRRLVYETAMERRRKSLEEKEGRDKTRGGDETVQTDFDEPEVDLTALSDTSRKLLGTAILFYGVFGLWLIWSDVFPAFRIFDEITLWHHTITVDGEDQVQPITLADLGLALIYLTGTLILAKQLPAILEIILLERFDMPSGNRYTVTTLTTYTIFTLGVVLVFNTIGADWSQLQWLIAALGVGIGFGLQEIVANFISGIIILFERPVRVGDVVTVGDTDGVVTRIRIRATTIRNWDGKELLVPNKEFITGRLLNWSLSDQTTRILVSVGIAYGSDVREAMRLLVETAEENKNVLDDPAPSVIFEAFGDNALTIVLRCFIDSVDLRFPTMSALNQAINEKFNAAGISIAFPQRDLHLDTMRPLQVELRHAGKAAPEGDAGE